MKTTNSHTIYHNLIIDAPSEKVYDAVSHPKHLINWWPLKCSGIREMGETYNFYFGDEYNWFGEVVRTDPNQSFHIKMTKSDKDWDPTTFGFDLESEKNQVSLSFWHSGWVECNDHFKIASFCWAMLLNGLKNYIEEGHIIPFEKRS